jgi:hypothetical protein
MSEPRQMLIDGVEPLPSAWTGEPDRVYILSNGLGTNSLAILAGIAERGLRLDANVFADTGNERPEIYANIEVINRWCEERGLPPITRIRGEQPQQVIDGNLLAECLRLRTMPAKVFGMPSCSQKWKIEPQARHQREWAAFRGIDEAKITRLVGFDADEHVRVHRGIGYDHARKHRQGYPLYEWGWTREDCVAAIDRAGLPQPGKSACFYCPSTTKQELLDLRAKHPKLLARALEMERIALSGDGKATGVIGLGRSFNWAKWLAQYDGASAKGAAFLAAQRDLLSNAGIPEADCACADGAEALS